MRILLLLLALVACGGRTEPTANPAPPAVGDVGATCSCGEAPEKGCTEVECKVGLVCMYPCGIPGCSSTCREPPPPGSPKIP